MSACEPHYDYLTNKLDKEILIDLKPEIKILGPNQLKYCRSKFPVFSIAEKQATKAKKETKAYREKYPTIHERKQ